MTDKFHKRVQVNYMDVCKILTPKYRNFQSNYINLRMLLQSIACVPRWILLVIPQWEASPKVNYQPIPQASSYTNSSSLPSDGLSYTMQDPNSVLTP